MSYLDGAWVASQPRPVRWGARGQVVSRGVRRPATATTGVIVGDQVQDDAQKIAERVRQMNKIKPFTVAAAGAMVRAALAAIDDASREAVKTRTPPWWAVITPITEYAYAFKVSEIPPRDGAVAKVYWKLRWHETEVMRLAATPGVVYPFADDLKSWTIQAFVEKNISSEERAYVDALWAAMWAEIGSRARAVATGDFKVPWWAWAVGGVVTVGVGAALVLPAVRR